MLKKIYILEFWQKNLFLMFYKEISMRQDILKLRKYILVWKFYYDIWSDLV